MTAVQLVAQLEALGYEAAVYIDDPDNELLEDGVKVRWTEATEEGIAAYQAQLETDAGMSVDYATWVLPNPWIDFWFFIADLGNLMPPRVYHHNRRRRP